MTTELTRTSEQPKLRSQTKSKFERFWQKYGIGYLFITPFFILFTVFVAIPVLLSLVLSFTYYNMIQPPRWLGLINFKTLILEDDVFLIAIKNTVIFALITGPIGYIGSFLSAWVINQLKFRNAFSLAFYAPSITSGIAMSVIWLYFFSSDRYGFINNILINLGIVSNPIHWNMSPSTIMLVVIFVSVWMSMGTGFLVFLAGLQTIPEELYNAGKIDGIRNNFQELRYITIPMVKPQLLFGAVTSIVSSFGVFDVAVSIAGMPSPDYAAHTIVAHLYDYAFIRFEMGYASAISLFLFLLTFTLGRISMKIFSTEDMY